MGYSKSPATLRAILDKLQPLAEGRPCAWDTPDNAATQWAYKVREGLQIALRYPTQFPELAKYAPYFVIEEVRHNKVQAKMAEFTPEQVVVTQPDKGMVTGGTTAGTSRTFGGPQTAMSVIQAWMESQSRFGHNDALHFPEANMSEAELNKLYQWTMKRTPVWMMLRPKGTVSLTLMPWDDQAAAVGANWSPNKPNG